MAVGRFRRWTSRAILATALFGSATARPADDGANDANDGAQRAQMQEFESHVRPLLAQRCVRCHGPDKQKGSLRLDQRGAALRGGETGPVIVPGQPGESLLVEAINYRSLEMPPQGRLPESEIAILTEWIARGAFWPDESDAPAVRIAPTGTFTDADRDHWAFQPLRPGEPPEPAGLPDGWSRTAIDRFVGQKLCDAGLQPGTEADRQTLIRRMTEDVTGLPPSPAEIDRFLSDEEPGAIERLVDRLLQSPRYGEHQARMWLDLVRYAESDGYKQDAYRPHAWRYRDYVIQSFNDDKPYDRFLTEQLAGDEIAPDDPEALIATGFYRHGIYEYNQRDVRGQRRDTLNDVTQTVADVCLALSVGCARCHDHKFDPILQVDFFRLQAFFAGLSFQDVPAVGQERCAAYEVAKRPWLDQTAEIRGRIDGFTRDRFARIEAGVIGKFAPELQIAWNTPLSRRTIDDQPVIDLMQKQVDEEINNFPKTLIGRTKEEWDALQHELAAFDSLKPADLPLAMQVRDLGAAAPEVAIPDRDPTVAIEPGFPSIFDARPAVIEPQEGSSGRRTSLARWLTRPDHPLTSRIIVNRIWQMHFGRGLVATPSDFGRLGTPPSHPELLDWLAVRFVDQGWRLKWLHRQILLSAAYRQTSRPGEDPADQVRIAHATEADSSNRWLWRYPIRRLTAEQIRDAALAASGELDLTPGGPASELDQQRRSVLTKVIHNRPDPLLDVFDFPERFVSVGARHVTTTPVQALFMINGDWMLQRARRFAERIDREVAGGEDSKVRLAYRMALGRDPSLSEIDRSMAFLFASGDGTSGADGPSPALVDLCHVLLNANEFLYLD